MDNSENNSRSLLNINVLNYFRYRCQIKTILYTQIIFWLNGNSNQNQISVSPFQWKYLMESVITITMIR